MTRAMDGRIYFAATEWAKLLLALIAHAAIVFGTLLFWANRIVVVETKVQALESGQLLINENLRELRMDVKAILRRTNGANFKDSGAIISGRDRSIS